MPETLTGRDLDMAVHRAMGHEVNDKLPPSAIPTYRRHKYPVVLEWCSEHGLYWSLERNYLHGEKDGTFDCWVSDMHEKHTGAGELQPTPGEAVCQALLAYVEKTRE